MKIFVATTETQGIRSNDFCFVPEGEMVLLGTDCDGGGVDDSCGCKRSMCGFTCHKATTTFKVVESDMTIREYTAAFIESDKASGFNSPVDLLKQDAYLSLEMASSYPVGTVLGRRGNRFEVREPKKS